MLTLGIILLLVWFSVYCYKSIVKKPWRKEVLNADKVKLKHANERLKANKERLNKILKGF
jgi:cell division protein FtsB